MFQKLDSLVGYMLFALSFHLVYAQDMCNFTEFYDRAEPHMDGQEVDEVITSREEDCLEDYAKLREKLDEIETEMEGYISVFNATRQQLEITFHNEFESLIDSCDKKIDRVEERAKESKWSENEILEETNKAKDQCDESYLNTYSLHEMEIYEVQALHKAELTKCRDELQEEQLKFDEKVTKLRDDVFKKVAPGAYEIHKEQYKIYKKERDLMEKIEKKMKEVRQKFEGGICCHFEEPNGDRMNDAEVEMYQTGLRHCFTVAMRKNGLTCNVKDVTVFDHQPMIGDIPELRNRRKLWSSYSCGACYSGSCGFSCPRNTYYSSGWRRQLEESNVRSGRNLPLDSVGGSSTSNTRELDAGNDVLKDLEVCMLEFMNRKLSRLFVDGEVEKAECYQCDNDACTHTALSINGFDFD